MNIWFLVLFIQKWILRFWKLSCPCGNKIAKYVFCIYIFLLCLLFLCSISMSFFVPLCSTSRLFVFNNQFVFIVGEKSFWWSTQPIWILHLVCVCVHSFYLEKNHNNTLEWLGQCFILECLFFTRKRNKRPIYKWWL